MSVQKSPPGRKSLRRGVNNQEIQWEEDLRPFSRLPRDAKRPPTQKTPFWIPALVSALAILFACVVANGFFNNAKKSLSTAAIFATPTPTSPVATPTERPLPATATPYVAPTDTPPPMTATPAAGAISVGGYVKIVDTGPNGLNFRREPSTTADKIGALAEGGVFQVVEGPANSGGITWWRLKNSDGTQGWGASTYMQPTAKP